MAQAADENVQPIVIKKVKKGGHGGHHGGAWKVAYADFVTAMMAFFLLLWLLSSTSEEQKKGIADYFSPASVSLQQSGSGGVLGGQTVTADGAMVNNTAPPTFMTDPLSAPMPPAREEEMDDESLEEALAKKEQEQFEEAAEELRQAIQSNPELINLQQNLLIEQTPEGLRIQIVDQEGQSMFPLAGSQMYPQTRLLLEQVAKAVAQMPNKLSISGHTDGLAFANGAVYDNWELSADRANASRRVLTSTGIAENRIANVVGKADREHLVPGDPASPRNRRISIVLLREAKPPAPAEGSSSH